MGGHLVKAEITRIGNQDATVLFPALLVLVAVIATAHRSLFIAVGGEYTKASL